MLTPYMFTGLIEAVAEVMEVTPTGLVIARPPSFFDLQEGESIAVNGVCLTVTSFTEQHLSFDIVEETRKRSTMGHLREGDHVNLERALQASDRLGGHMVQGHVDSVGEVRSVEGEERGEGVKVTIAYPPELQGLIVEKGSITIDGVSLTVTYVDKDIFSIALIPVTEKQTTLGTLQQGQKVNLETDIVGKYLKNMV